MIKFISLTECLDKIIDNRGKTVPTCDYGIPLIATNCISNEMLYPKFDKIRYISIYTYNTFFRDYLEPGDIIFVNKGTPGKVNMCPEPLNFMIAQDAIGLRVNNKIMDNKYLFYALRTNKVQTLIKNNCVGLIIPHFKKEFLNRIEIPYIDLKYQKKIGNILFMIDNQIEKNKTIIKKIEDLAKKIYNFWFLQFEFPNEIGKPFKSSGGKMVWNEELKREIPINWEIKKLKDIVYLGNDKKYNGPNVKTIDMSVMPSNSISLNELNYSDNFETNLFKMKKYDILFGSIRPYLKKAGIAPCDGAFAGTVHCFRCYNDFDYNFALETLTSGNMFDYACKNSKGSKMPVIGADRILEYPVPYNEEIVRKFNSFDFKKIIVSNIMQNQELASLRDFLLPLLMNGQVTFNEDK